MGFACWGRAALLGLLTAASSAAQHALPPLPRPALDLFPAAARETVSREYQRAAARSTDAAAVGAFGRVLHGWEQWELAHQVYARAQALAPKTFEWHYLDAVVLQRLARHGEAAARLRAALDAAPDFKPARIKLADALFDAGAVEESRRVYEALAADPATEPMGVYGLGRIAAAEKRHEEAVRHLERAVELVPSWGSAHYALALSYRALGRRDAAERALERHASYGPQWPAIEDPILAALAGVRDDPRGILQRGIVLAERGDIPEAIAAHEAALARDPSLLQAHVNLISLYGRQGNWEKGETHYKAAVRLGGDLRDAHYDYGVMLGLQQKWDEAAAAYRTALAANPLHARASNNLGEIFERQRNVEAALGAYMRAVESQPTFRLARFNAARMLIGLGRTGEAVSHLEQIVEPRDAEAPRYLFALSVAYVRAGRKEDGIKWATEARALALQHGQQELAAAIERDLARLK